MIASKEIGQRIKEIAKENNILIKDLLKEANISINTIVNMKTSYPQVNNLIKIADILNVSLDYLTGRTENKEINK